MIKLSFLVASIILSLSVNASTDVTIEDCFWTRYFDYTDNLSSKMHQLEFQYLQEADLGKRAGIKADFLRIEAELNLTRASRRAVLSRSETNHRKNLQDLAPTFFAQCAQIAK